MEQVRLCAVLPTENWLASSMNHIQGRMTVWICYCHALEKGCLVAGSPDDNLVDSLAFAIASFAVRELDQNFVPSSKRLSMRIVCFTVMMSGFILYSTYAATMTSFLSISLKTPSIATLEDVVGSGKTSLLLYLLDKVTLSVRVNVTTYLNWHSFQISPWHS